MKKEEIIERNKLIAEFMELQSSKVANGLSDIKYKHNFTQHGFYEETNEGMLLFHSSWDWLMPCCIKMIRLSPEKCSLLREYLGNCDIDKVYKQLIFLIKNLD